MSFTLDRFQRVDQQVRDLAEKATSLGIRQAYVDALRKMVDNLANRPLEWGDPEYHTKEPGGLICHAIAEPLLVRFVVFEERKIVVISDIASLPYSPLADP